MKELFNITRELKRIREAVPSNDAEKRQQKMIQERMEKQMRLFVMLVICNEACIFSEPCLESSIDFYARFTTVLMTHLSPSNPESPELPLSPSPPGSWSCLNECLLEDLIDYTIFIARHTLPLLHQIFQKYPIMVTFIITVTCSPNYFRNPYLVAKFIELIFTVHPRFDI